MRSRRCCCRRVGLVGDDGVRVSARQICEETGIDLELLEAVQRAHRSAESRRIRMRSSTCGPTARPPRRRGFSSIWGSSRTDDHCLPGAGPGSGADGRGDAPSALEAVSRPGATELQIAQAYGVLVQQVSPLLGPLCEDVLLLQLRHSARDRGRHAAERAAGVPLPGARRSRSRSPTLSASRASARPCLRKNWRASPTGYPSSPVTSPPHLCASSRRLATR